MIYSGRQYGILLKYYDESKNQSNMVANFFGSDAQNRLTEYWPAIFIQYNDVSGIEDYMTYTSQDGGVAGSGYINNFSGNLTWMFQDFAYDGLRLPVSVSHVYSSCDHNAIHQNLDVGKGFRLSALETFKKVNNDYFEYIDGDGTKHYFSKQGGIWKDETGLGYELIDPSSTEYYTIKDKKGNKKYFYKTDGRVRMIRDNNNNQIDFSYVLKNNKYILSSITDGAGRVATFVSNNDGRLEKIQLEKVENSTAIREINFQYTDYGRLLRVIYPSANTSVAKRVAAAFEYNGDGHMVRAIDETKGTCIEYDYSATALLGNGAKRIFKTRLRNYSGSPIVTEREYRMEYEVTRTIVRETIPSIDRWTIYEFNSLGQTVSVRDSKNNSQYFEHGMSGGAKNKVTFTSKVQNPVTNLLKNHSFEFPNGSENYTFINSSTNTFSVGNNTPYIGSKNLKILKPSTSKSQWVFSRQSITLTGGKKYTFSMFGKVKNLTGDGAYMGIQTFDGSIKETQYYLKDLEYTRYSVTIDLTKKSGNISCFVFAGIPAESYGEFYTDAWQVEEYEVANRYNIAENGDFSRSNLNLTLTAGASISSQTLKIVGEPKSKRYGKLTIPGAIKKGDSFTIVSKVKGTALVSKDPNNTGEGQGVGHTIELIKNDNSKIYKTVMLQTVTADYQYLAKDIIADADCKGMNIYLKSNYNIGTIYFDDVQVYRDNFGQSFTYDSKGNVVNTQDLAKNTEQMIRNGDGEVTKYKDGMGYEYNFTYKSGNPHTLKTVTAPNGVITDISSNWYNLPETTKLSNTVDGVTKYTETTTKYKTAGEGNPKNYNYIDHTVDEFGNTTYFNYDLNTGILNDTTAPDGTKIIHKYNPTTLALTGTSVEGALPNVSYMYDKNELMGISVASNTGIRPGFLFKKDKFGRTTKVVQAIFNGANITEGNALVENTYHENRGLLRNSKYGNNQTVAYSYDSLDRMTDIWYFDTPRYSTIYDKSGNIAAVIDRNNINGYSTPLETKYQYDLADRMIQITSNNGFTSKGYKYDKNNRLTTYSNALRSENNSNVSYNLVTSYGYQYNNINAVKKEEIKNFTSNMATIDHSYDQLGRSYLTHHNYGSDIAHNIYSRPVFKDIGTDGKTTNQISQYLVNLSSGPCEYTFGYEYDTLGNIKKYLYNNSPITYSYDKLNQLKTSSKNGVTTSYTYDIRGNITSVKENENELEKTFKYGDSPLNVSDVLTEFCEKTLSDSMTKTYTSDKIGNPTKLIIITNIFMLRSLITAIP